MKKILTLLMVVLAVFAMSSCTEQSRAKDLGGETTIKLEPGQKLVEATWKGDGDLWYLTEPMDSDYIPKTKIFQESSSWDIMEGTVTFIETR